MQDLNPEIEYNFMRSSGPGGQNVNKVSTKAELRFNVIKSVLLTDSQKERIKNKLANRMNANGEIVLRSDETRSQVKNKEIVTVKFYELIKEALKKERKRVPTKPSRAAKEKRLKEKKIQSEKKEIRKKPGI